MLENLWIGYNKTADFRILICAYDEIDAYKLANEYGLEAHIDGEFKILEPSIEDKIDDIHFDCDYVITYCHTTVE